MARYIKSELDELLQVGTSVEDMKIESMEVVNAAKVSLSIKYLKGAPPHSLSTCMPPGRSQDQN